MAVDTTTPVHLCRSTRQELSYHTLLRLIVMTVFDAEGLRELEARLEIDPDAEGEVCANCPVCRTARKKGRGLAFWLVSRVERGACPFCAAYERVTGRKAHGGP